MSDDLTDNRMIVLNLCIDAGGAGHAPQGKEWPPIYWLRDRGLVEMLPQGPAAAPRFRATAMGKSLIEIRRKTA